MKFPYREYVSVFPGSTDFRLILRPVITIRVVGPKADARWDALVDSGADETLFPLSLAEVLGVELDEELISEVAGISGDRGRVFSFYRATIIPLTRKSLWTFHNLCLILGTTR